MSAPILSGACAAVAHRGVVSRIEPVPVRRDALAARVALAPEGPLGAIAAKAAGRTGSIETHATITAWPWVCVVAGVLLLLAAVAGWLGAAHWRGLGARYEAPTTSAGARGQRVATDWDRLDAGDDPTLRDGSAGT